MTEERTLRFTARDLGATARTLILWIVANSLAGALVGVAIALFADRPGALESFIPLSILFANAVGFAAGLSARFILPRYSALPVYVRIPLAVITLFAGGAFGSVLVIFRNPIFVLYQSRLTLLLVLVDSVIAVIVGFIIYNYERMRQEIERGYSELAENRVREERLKELATRSELKALKAQINPHFLFNALNSISALTAIDPEAARRTLERLASVFRKTLLASEESSVPLTRELELVDAYLDIERARFGDRMCVEHSISPGAGDVEIPPLILQAVVENAVRHGISPSVTGGTVSIDASLTDGFLVITVRDDGVGVSTDDLEDAMSSGYGLRSVRDRLNTRYGAGDWLMIKSESGLGMTVRLTIPIDAADWKSGTGEGKR